MGYIILGMITFVLIIYFIYDSIRTKHDERDLSDEEIRSLYEGDVDEHLNPEDIKTINARLSTEIAEEVLNSEEEFLRDDDDEELKR